MDSKKKNNAHQKLCDYCKRPNTINKWKKSRTIPETILCNKCNHYEYRHGKLDSLDQRRKYDFYGASKGPCQFCGCKSSSKGNYLSRSETIADLKICRACLRYEKEYDDLLIRNRALFKKGEMIRALQEYEVTSWKDNSPDFVILKKGDIVKVADKSSRGIQIKSLNKEWKGYMYIPHDDFVNFQLVIGRYYDISKKTKKNDINEPNFDKMSRAAIFKFIKSQGEAPILRYGSKFVNGRIKLTEQARKILKEKKISKKLTKEEKEEQKKEKQVIIDTKEKSKIISVTQEENKKSEESVSLEEEKKLIKKRKLEENEGKKKKKKKQKIKKKVLEAIDDEIIYCVSCAAANNVKHRYCHQCSTKIFRGIF